MAHEYPPKFNCKPIFPRLDPNYLEQYEAWLGTTLPADFRQFLLEWNGIQFQLDRFEKVVVCPSQAANDHSDHVPSWDRWQPEARTSSNDSVSPVHQIFGICARELAEIDTLWRGIEMYEFKLRVPDRFIVIGDAEYSITLLCMSLCPPDRGHIYTYLIPIEEFNAKEDRKDMSSMNWLAPNFREFWDALRCISYEEKCQWD